MSRWPASIHSPIAQRDELPEQRLPSHRSEAPTYADLMYQYLPHHPCSGVRSASLFGKAELSSPRVQAWLAEAAEGRADVTCLCRGTLGLPMVTHLRKLRYLRREPHSGAQHSPGCLHHDIDASSLGLAPGGLLSKKGKEGELVVDLDRLLRLDDDKVGQGSGGRAHQIREYTPPLHGLLWLLLLRAGLNVDHVDYPSQRPWAEFAEATRTIRLAGQSGDAESLQRHILLPKRTSTTQAVDNQAMLERHLRGPRCLLFAGVLRPDDLDGTPQGGFHRMRETLGASVSIDCEVLKRALKRCPDARECIRLNRPVLAFGTVEARRYKTPMGAVAISGWVRQLTLLSVHDTRLVPMPGRLRERHSECMAARQVFVAKPADDPLMRVQRAS